MEIKCFLLKIFVTVFRIVYFPIKLLPAKKKVVFISRQSNSMSIDISLLNEYLNSNYPDIITIILTKKLEYSLAGVFTYLIHIFKQMYHISTSKVVIVDGYCIAVSVLNHKKGVKIIQIWHALGAIKKFGYQTINKTSGHSESISKVMCMHRNYDFVLCASEKTGQYFCEAFNVENEKMKYLGLPRIDYIMKDDTDAAYKIREFYNIKEQKEVVLYVPTFRKNSNVDIEKLIGIFDFDKAVLVIKLHPLEKLSVDLDKKFVAERNENSLIIDNKYTSYQWLNVCDKIVTDYSALGIEATLKKKPLYFYLYDIDEYVKTVGLNINLKDEFGKYAVYDVQELSEVINEGYDFEIIEKFASKYITVPTDNCTKRIARFINELVEEE